MDFTRILTAIQLELEKTGIIHDGDRFQQTIRQQVRYRLYRGDVVVREEICEADERWYYPHELSLMLERAGFAVEAILGDYGAGSADARSYVMTCHARRPE